MKLYSYFRAFAAYRVHIALQIKALDYGCAAVKLLRQEQA